MNGEAVVKEGLAPGEQVVTDGQLRLVPGARVQIKQEPVAKDKSS
jgi:multidrug efflux system membrane fusion protein